VFGEGVNETNIRLARDDKKRERVNATERERKPERRRRRERKRDDEKHGENEWYPLNHL
jgi:hypothetical protein